LDWKGLTKAMNYAHLNKLEAASDTTAGEQIELTKKRLGQLHLPSLVETTFYQSATHPQQFYTFSLWWELAQLKASGPVWTSHQFRPANLKTHSLERQTFGLCWEYALLVGEVAASNLILINYPKGYSPQQAEAELAGLRKEREELRGLRRAWVGLSVNPRHLVAVIRQDWQSLSAQKEFFNAKKGLPTLGQEYTQAGLEIEYASFDWQGWVPQAQKVG
jgi:hypothetical protein